jgi:hypothetical protein
MTRHSIVGFIVAGGLAIASNAAAQRWGWPDYPQRGACFFEDAYFSGQYFCVRAGTNESQVPPGTNDRISSIRVFGGVRVTVFKDSNYHGSSRSFDNDMSDLRRSGWNDRISSFRIGSRSDGNWGGGNWGGGGNNGGGNRWTYRQAESMVKRAYRSVLGRDPDPSGLRSWTDNVMGNNWSEQQLIDALQQSDEYRDAHRRR